MIQTVDLWLIGSFLFTAGCFEGIMDFLNFKYTKDHWYWNVKQASINKWNEKLWIEQGIKKERFLGSSTIFVFLFDGWHLMKWFRNRWIDSAFIYLLAFAFGFWYALLYVVVFRIAIGVGFEINYRLLKKIHKVQ
jgi:uncharacterized membrane protein